MQLERPAEAGGGWSWISIPVIAAAIRAAYANAFDAGFQFDDWNVIVHESRVHTLAAWWASMPAIRPLLKLSYALNHVCPRSVSEDPPVGAS